MSKIKYCALCGGFGASPCHVEGLEFSGTLNLCSDCDEQINNYDIKGKTKEDFIDQALEAPFNLNGPKSYIDSFLLNGLRERSNWGLLNICPHCNRKFDELLQLRTSLEHTDGFGLKITPELQKVLPKKQKNSLTLCRDCIQEYHRKDLALLVNYQVKYLDGDIAQELTFFVKDLISRKLKNQPEEVNNIKNPKTLRCLDISIKHITAEDLSLFENDGEFNYEKGTMSKDQNPIFVSSYDHGFIIQISETHKHAMETFGYSQNLIGILQWATEKYDILRFDSAGPIYKEFTLPE
jgi:hypothetical protein